MIIVVGGNLNMSKKSPILRKLKEKLSDDIKIGVIPTASEDPILTGKMYEDALRLFGFDNVSTLPIMKREDASAEEFLKYSEEADMLLLTGGDQLRLTSLLGGTSISDIIRKKGKNGVIMGISAGATVLSDFMIYDGKGKRGFLKGEVEITSGFGLLENVAIDSHFIKRGRIPRLIYVVVSNPKLLGVGLGENTAMFVEDDIAEVWGTNTVIIVDGSCIENTNIALVKKRKPIAATNIYIHVLTQGTLMNLKERKVLKLG